MKQYKKLIFLVIFILFLSIFYFFNATYKKDEEPPKVVEVVIASKENIERTARLIGTVRPKHSTQLIAKSSGLLNVIKIAGSVVKKDTLIAKIINDDIEKNYSYVESAEKIALDQYNRVQSLFKTGAVSKQTVDEKKTAWLEAGKNRAAAKIALDKIFFYAPFDGVIGSYKARSGTEVNEGTSLITFYDPNVLVVEFDIPGPLLASINVGQKVVIADKAYALQHVQKMIAEDTHMSPATVEIATRNHVIGMSLDVDLTVLKKDDVIVLPIDALFLEEGKTHVYTVKNSKALLTPVDIGVIAKDKVEIAKGLNVGDNVVAYGQARLSNDSQVKIFNNEKSQTNAATQSETQKSAVLR